MQKPFILRPEFFSVSRYVVAPMVVILVSKIFFEQIAFDFPQYTEALAKMLTQTPPAPLSSIALHEAKARLLWLISAILYLFISCSYVIYLYTLIKKHADKSGFWILIVSSFFAAIEILFLLLLDKSNSPIHHIFLFSFNTLSISGLIPANSLDFIHHVLDLINILTIFIPFYVILGACTIVYQHQQQPLTTEVHLKDFRELIHGASAVMIAGIIHMQLWLSWPISLSEQFSINTEAKTLIITILQYWGVCYSLTIAMLYLPIKLYFEENKSSSDSNASTYSIGQKIFQITSILGPSLVGAIAPELTNILNI